MKTFYYFSEKKLKFVEIKKFHRKFLALVASVSLIISAVALGSYVMLSQRADLEKLQNENVALVSSLENLLTDYSHIENKIDHLSHTSNTLRLANNLKDYSEEELAVGIGGRSFKEINAVGYNTSVGVLDSLRNKFSSITAKLNFEKHNIDEISGQIEQNSEFYNCVPAIKPADAPLGDLFGIRFHPILKRNRSHNGLDIRCNTGTNIYAPGDGVVIKANWRGGYGRTIEIDHGYGYRTIFAHLYRYKVKVGDKVKRGDLIALSGSSGKLSTGPHLHYEVKYNGSPVDPLFYFYEDLPVENYRKLAHK